MNLGLKPRMDRRRAPGRNDSPEAAPGAVPAIRPALWYDGQSAAAHNVEVRVQAGGLHIRGREADGKKTGSGPAIWPLDRLRLVSGDPSGKGARRTPPEPLRIGLSPDDGQRLVFTESRAATAFAAQFERQTGKRFGPSAVRRRWLLATLAVWLLAAAFYLLSPVVFSGLARVMPYSLEARLGELSYDAFLQSGMIKGIDEEAGRDPGLRLLTTRLASAPPAYAGDFRVEVARAAFVNAFALPGGRIIVTTRLVEECASPEELAGVLAHEMAHVTERHGMGSMLRSQAWSMLLELLGMGRAGAVPLAFINSSFSRNDERRADSLGVQRLCGAGIAPDGMIVFFARLAEKEGSGKSGRAVMRYASTHPAASDRQEAVAGDAQRFCGRAEDGPVAALPAPSMVPAMDPADWLRFKALCASTAAGDKDLP